MVLFATLLALLGGLVAAPAPGYADPNPWTDWPQVAAPGDELAITINMYRFRYTVSPPSPIVKWETNVAAFPFQHNGKDMVIVTNNIGRFPNNPQDRVHRFGCVSSGVNWMRFVSGVLGCLSLR